MTEEQMEVGVPALDQGEENPDLCAGDEVEPEHDLNVDEFAEGDEE